MKAQGIDPDTFGSEINAADLIDLRKVLGYQKWDLIGVSYGGRFVQEAMRRDATGTRSVIMHSPAFVGGGVEYEGPRTYQRLLEHIFASCAAQGPCAAAFPSLEKDFYEVYDELNKTPLDVVLERGDDSMTVRFDGERFLSALRNNFAQKLNRIPIIINELKRGDRKRVAEFLVADSRAGSGFNNALTDLVGCYDGYGRDYLKKEAAIVKQVREPFRSFANDLQECVIWHSRFARTTDHSLVKSNIPALVFTAEFDHLSPFDFGKQIVGQLKAGYHFELPGQTHGSGIRGCGESIIFQFLKDPMKKPDASCVTSIAKVAFELRRFEKPNLIFTVSAADGKKTPFEGTWEAVFPSAPIVLRIGLKTNGGMLTGSFLGPAGIVELYDGRVSDDTMAFKIKSPEEGRVITFTGKLTGESISFIRDVEVLPGSSPGGAFIFGAAGARYFTATRAK